MNIAICGLDCAGCPAYIVHTTGDKVLQKATAKKWTEEYGHEMSPEMVDCAGCAAVSGPHIGYCAVCEIRKCGLEKQVENCAFCADYPCATLSGFFGKAVQAKENLEKIRAGRKSL